MAEPHRDPGTNAGASTGSVFGKSAPSWTYAGYRFRNGWAVLTLALGMTSAFLISTPGLIFVPPGVVVAGATGLCSYYGRRRIRDFPAVGGRRMIAVGLGAIPAGALLAVFWLGTGA